MFALLLTSTLANEGSIVYHKYVYKYIQTHPEWTQGIHDRAINTILKSDYYGHFSSYVKNYPYDFINQTNFSIAFREKMFRLACEKRCDCDIILYKLRGYVEAFPDFRQDAKYQFFNICHSLIKYSQLVEFFPENNTSIQGYERAISRCDKNFYILNKTFPL